MSIQTETQPAPAANNAPAPTLSPFAQKMLAALQRLTKERQPHLCGGFTTDDMQWQMGIAFTPQDELHEALDELEKAGLIRYAGEDEEDAIGICYALHQGTPRNLIPPARFEAIELFATIKKSSKYYGQDHDRVTRKPKQWPVRWIDSRDSYGFHGNSNQYRREDLTFWVKARDGSFVKLN